MMLNNVITMEGEHLGKYFAIRKTTFTQLYVDLFLFLISSSYVSYDNAELSYMHAWTECGVIRRIRKVVRLF